MRRSILPALEPSITSPRTFTFTAVFTVASGQYQATCPAFPAIRVSSPTLDGAKASVTAAILSALEQLIETGAPIPADQEPTSGTGIFREEIAVTPRRA